MSKRKATLSQTYKRLFEIAVDLSELQSDFSDLGLRVGRPSLLLDCQQDLDKAIKKVMKARERLRDLES